MPVTRRDFFRTLFVASQATLASRLLPNPLLADDSAPHAKAINFAIIGDWGRYGRPDQVEVAKQMAIACKNAGASFVISVGDNFYDDGVASLTDRHWQQSFENVYSDPALQVPWYVTLGNHDYHVDPQPQLDYGQTHPRWIMPTRYYSKVMPIGALTTAEFFFIDTNPLIDEYKRDAKMAKFVNAQDATAQLDWLDTSLRTSRAGWKIVVGHHPIYSAGYGHGDQPEMIKLVLPILQRHNVPAYFCGHDHDLQHLKAGPIDLILSGGGSEHTPVGTSDQLKFGGSISGFAMASLRAEGMDVRFIDNKGNVLHTANVQRTV